MSTKQVTIIVPNYKTYELTKVCLRLLRKNTDLNHADVIVVDNNSNDESTKYLKNLHWIKFIHRDGILNEGGPMSHARALDLAMENIDTPYVIVIHTDTFMIHPGWLNILMQPFNDPDVAGVGSWKLEQKNIFQRLGKHIEYLFKKLQKNKINNQRFNKEYHYLRSHCAIYKTDLIKNVNSSFSDQNESAGKVLHKKLIHAGYKMIFLESNFLNKYVHHINHATQAINDEFGIRSANKVIKDYFSYMNRTEIKEILKNDSLDN